jgi:hypothetical protein
MSEHWNGELKTGLKVSCASQLVQVYRLVSRRCVKASERYSRPTELEVLEMLQKADGDLRLASF